ncbi:hypothetical protein MSPP1_002872 [Malassezia sp. CBS 17886]|nr:hypothetical protein MSPP1_002872 [Malassezia sp. CBS 17886]
MSLRPYIVVFRASVTEADIDKYAEEVKEQGGAIRHRYDADFMRGFAAELPPAFADKLIAASEGGAHSSMCVWTGGVLTGSEYVEADQEMHMQ